MVTENPYHRAGTHETLSLIRVITTSGELVEYDQVNEFHNHLSTIVPC